MKVKYADKNVDFKLDTQRFDKQNSLAQKWLDNEVLKDTTPYVPFRTGFLEHSGVTGTRLGSGRIGYSAPYASKMYYGVQYNFNKASHPKAQAYWFEASKAVNKGKWIRITKKIAGGG